MALTGVPGAPASPPGLAMDPRIRQRRVEVEQARGRRRRQVAVGLASAATLVAAGFLVLHSSLLGAHRITVAGPDPVGPAALLRSAGIRRGEPLVDVDPPRAERRLEAVPWVRTATVRRRWPRSLRVTLTERVAVAQISTSPRGRAVALVDATGRVVAERPAPAASLPLLAGVGPTVPAGEWLRGSAGPGGRGRRPVEAPASGPAAVALTVAAALDADHLAATRIDLTAGRVPVAVIGGGATTVSFGSDRDLVAKLQALRALQATGALRHAAAVDLEVPSRPAVTAAGASSTSEAASPASGSGSAKGQGSPSA